MPMAGSARYLQDVGRDTVRAAEAGARIQRIAEWLSISMIRMQKHLEHAYVKLGVQSRTAAVMRVAAKCWTCK